MSYRFPVLLAISLASSLSLTAMAQDEDAAPAAAPTPPPAPPVEQAAPPPKPAGNPQNPKVDAPPPAPVTAVSRDVPDCQTYLASPLDGGMVERDSKLYFISPKLPSDQSLLSNGRTERFYPLLQWENTPMFQEPKRVISLIWTKVSCRISIFPPSKSAH
ncbi:MAG: hypothetical protein EOP07_21570 [Proteobacteria bacterium]|nr:MAG: hypothetical protein EOP07_21570 [Pseudomonadota bacterium]